MAVYNQNEQNITHVVDASDSVAIINDVSPPFTHSSAKLMSMRNDGTEVGGISSEGVFFGHAIDIKDMAYIQVSLDTTASTLRSWTIGQIDTWTDFSLTYNTYIAKGWTYDDTSKVFTYNAEHPQVFAASYGLTCERTDTGASPSMEIIMARSTDGTNYTNIDETLAARQFSGNDIGYMGFAGILHVNPGDTLKMQVLIRSAGVDLDFHNITMNLTLVDSYPTGSLVN